MPNNLEIIFRILLAFILGGVVGFEREGLRRPAGLRTHMLVSTASCLIMITGISMSYHSIHPTDPSRLAAQVISGMGFLGAGTILKEGASVSGLTTAAGLWSVAGIGLAVGSGFYIGAGVSSFLIFIALATFPKIEKFITYREKELSLKIVMKNEVGQIGKIGTELGRMNIHITQILTEEANDSLITLHLNLKTGTYVQKEKIVESILKVNGVQSVETY